MSWRPKKKIRCTSVQKVKLVELMCQYKELALGTMASPMEQQKQEEIWRKMADELNELGPSKSLDQWKTTWRDLKRKARFNNATIKSQKHTVDPMEDVPTLSASDRRILALIGKTPFQSKPKPKLESEASGIEMPSDSAVSPSPPPSLTSPTMPTPPAMPIPRRMPPPSPPPQLPTPSWGPVPREAKYLAHIFETGDNGASTAVLSEISKHLEKRNVIQKQRNDIEEERNRILRERNRLIQLMLQLQPQQISIEDEIVSDEDNV